MPDHRRPNDHLVEPLFGGLEGAGGPAPAASPRRVLLVALGLAVVVIGVAVLVVRF